MGYFIKQVSWANPIRMGKNFSLIILSLLLAFNILAWIVVFDLSKIQPLEVVFLMSDREIAFLLKLRKNSRF